MSRNKLMIAVTVLLILAALSLHDKDIRISGKAGTEFSGTFEAVDEPPKLLVTIPNQTIEPDQNISMNLGLYFREPNGDALAFSYNQPENFTVSLDNSTGIINLTPQEGWKGRNALVITAYDPAGNNGSSNNITLLSKAVTVHYLNYSGSTTNFAYLTDQELQNISSLTIENVSAGKIIFGQAINISGETELNLHVEIGDNSITINSTALPGFNRTAMLSLYNLTFANPRILRDGELCPGTVCAEINYTAGTGVFIFNVTGFTTYSAEETPEEAAQETPEAGGGGDTGGGGSSVRGPIRGAGAAPAPRPWIELDSPQIQTDVRQNRVKREVIKASNPTDSPVEIGIGLTSEIDFVHRESTVIVPPGETRDIEFIIAPTEENAPDTYTSEIILKKDEATRYVPLIINVQALLHLLDLEMDIYSENAEVSSGDNLLAGIRVYNLGESEKVSVAMEWGVKDFNNNVLLKENDFVDVETQTAFVKKMFMPSTMKQGKYVLVATAAYGESAVVASQMFTITKTPVIEKPTIPESGLLLMLIIVAVAIVLLVIALIATIIYEKRKIDHLVTKDDRILHDISERIKHEDRQKK